MDKKIAIISLGCSKNAVDSDQMMNTLKKHGFTLTKDETDADIVVVNTCGFIESAKEESIDTIIEIGEYKRNGKCEILLVAGCLGERYKDELMKELPEIDGILGTGNINEIVDVVDLLLKGEKTVRVGEIDRDYDEEIIRVTEKGTHTSYIKIAEGCDNLCTYCIIPKLRGKYRSRALPNIIDEAKSLVESGTREIVLIAQDTTKYGIDLYGEYRLSELLDELNKIEKLKWIRILYLYPDTFEESLIKSIKRNSKVTKYVDIPIQHISNSVLKRMNRKTSKESITKLIENLRREMPDIIIRTTLIVGFPGETEEEFEELYDYVEDMKFDRLGVFTYSKEEDTPAALLDEQIDEYVKVERQQRIMELQQRISTQLNSDKVNKIYEVMIDEKVEEGVFLGRTYMDSPEIDGVVYVHTDKKLKNGDFVDVKISSYLEYDLIGEMIDEPSK